VHLWFCLAAVAIVPSARAQNLPVVYALLVADSRDAKIGPGVAKDVRRMEDALQKGMGSARLRVRILEEGDANAAAILDYYDRLTIRPSIDVLLFHYAGHAGMLEGGGPREHVLQMQQGTSNLRRSVLRDAMKAKDPALIVMLTDCCSSKIPVTRRVDLPDQDEDHGVYRADRLAPGYDRLFFRTREIVDITAAEDWNSAIGDNEVGGLFTYALWDALIKCGDRRDLTWNSFYPALKRSMEEERVRRRFRKQTPRAFSLPGVAWGFTADRDGDMMRVGEVCLDSAAEQAGLRNADVIVEVGGRTVHNAREIAEVIYGLQPGDPLELTVRRDGRMMRVVIVRR
jgi:hypothetical protein